VTAARSIPRIVRDLAADRRTRPALIVGDEVRDWQTLAANAARIARSMQSRGVREGNFVTVALPNGVDSIETCLAIWMIGATPQPISHRAMQAELERVVALAWPTMVVSEQLGGSVAGVPIFGASDLRQASQDGSPLPERISPSLKAPLSGGSTGDPKIIVATQSGIIDPASLEMWRLGPDDTVLMPGPLSHNAPFLTTFLALFAGATVVLMPRFEPEEALSAIERHRATWVYFVPTMMQRIMRLPRDILERSDLSSIRTLWHLAAPCAPWLKEAWIDLIGPDGVWELYAGTEGQAATIISGRDWLSHRGSVGRVAFGEMKVVASDGRDAAPGEPGEIYMRPAGGVPTYRYIGAEPERLGDWETLGDVGWFDADGYLFLGDRRGDMVLVGGSNVYPAEVERVIDAHPGVLASAVIGLPDDDLGHRLHAIVQTQRPVCEAELSAHVAGLLTPYKRPRTYEFVTDDIRDAAGKVRRSDLRNARLTVEALR
jgi:bile acid-coenzyme A ligase